MTDLYRVETQARHPANTPSVIGVAVCILGFLILLPAGYLSRVPNAGPEPVRVPLEECWSAQITEGCRARLPPEYRHLPAPEVYADHIAAIQQFPPVEEAATSGLVRDTPGANPSSFDPVVHLEHESGHFEANPGPYPDFRAQQDAMLAEIDPSTHPSEVVDNAHTLVTRRMLWWDTVRRNEVERRREVLLDLWAKDGIAQEQAHQHWEIARAQAIHAERNRTGLLTGAGIVGLLGLVLFAVARRTEDLEVVLTQHVLRIGEREIPVFELELVALDRRSGPYVKLKSGERITLRGRRLNRVMATKLVELARRLMAVAGQSESREADRKAVQALERS